MGERLTRSGNRLERMAQEAEKAADKIYDNKGQNGMAEVTASLDIAKLTGVALGLRIAKGDIPPEVPLGMGQTVVDLDTYALHLLVLKKLVAMFDRY